MDGLYDLLIVDFASKPFQVNSFLLLLNGELYFPKGLRDEFFDFLGLINTEAKSWRLAWAISDRNLCATAAST